VQDKVGRNVRAKILIDAAGRNVRDPMTGMPLVVDDDSTSTAQSHLVGHWRR